MNQEMKPFPVKKIAARTASPEGALECGIDQAVETRHRFWGTHLNARAFFTLDNPPGSLLRPLRVAVRWN